MIEIICSDERYAYNMYHITKAFFPGEKVFQNVEEKAPYLVSVKLPDGQTAAVNWEEIPYVAGTKESRGYADKKLYQIYEELTEHSLSWGFLTGIRPTKIAMRKQEEGMDAETFTHWFQQQFCVSREKAELAWEIAGRERTLLSALDYKDGYSLYVGIPFCPTVCSYCSFSSGALSEWQNRVEEYVDALCRELRYIASASKDKKLNTIYVGGGTPTTLTDQQLKKLLSCIAEAFPMEHLLEYTVEAGRPDSITADKLSVLKDYGVGRISINPQTMQQKTLDVIGRKHTTEAVISAYRMAREAGFANINMDLIAGLPGEGLLEMQDTLRQIEQLAPESLTVHSLAIKRAAKMGQEQNEKGYVSALGTDVQRMSDTISGMIKEAAQSAKRMELLPYYLYRQKNIAGNFENVGYAKVDKAGIYNILIMEEKQSIIAAGAGASTKIVLKEPVVVPGSKKKKKTSLMRIENVKAIDAYIERVDEMIERKGEWLWH